MTNGEIHFIKFRMYHTRAFIDSAVCDTEAFIKAAGITESTFGWRAVRDSTVVDRLRRGQVTLRTVEKMQAYIRDNRIYPDRNQATNAALRTAK